MIPAIIKNIVTTVVTIPAVHSEDETHSLD